MKKLVGICAALALLGSGSALAKDDPNKPQPQGSSGSMQHDTSMGGSGAPMGSSSAMGQKELSGKVVKAESSKVFVQDAQGAVVTLDIDKSTMFTDPTLKKAKDLKEGQEIRASFEVKETKNMAKSISLSGTGGTGKDVMSPDSSINEGTGGSGMDADKDRDMGGSDSGNKSTQPDTY
ncbi:hypothetical protein [Myxococcus landrumensis]|uniref:DUF5666 domain-containing protein n=1 Tax=Myxococcus landrumensis TaxID=2813577 RepID=A0ABX7NKI8_9BACT|nr:hypothetical protein [Myxococcus landrumus]QSQ16778.1 hypothetical protein JY572_12305 [Myxococcus landrumus]